MKLKREWATPLTIGAFFLMGVTGVLMFFHLESGRGKAAHEWLGWLFIAGVALHVTVNFTAFRRHFTQGPGPGRWVVAGFVVLTAAMLLAPAEKDDNPVRRAADAVMIAPPAEVAPLAHKDAAVLLADLRAAGFAVTGPQQSLSDLAGDDHDAHHRAIDAVFGTH